VKFNAEQQRNGGFLSLILCFSALSKQEIFMIKAVIFDVGGVLIRTAERDGRIRWDQKLGLEPGQTEELVFASEMGTKAQAGAVSDDALWQWLGEHLALSPAELAQFRADFWAGDALDEELAAYIRRLRPAYQTAIISNATDNLRRTLQTTYPIAGAFDLIVCSAEEQVMKPDRRIYQRTLERLEREPEETVFIDDFAHNVAAARELGMHAIHYRPDTDAPAALATMGVAPPEE
jgi:putative hydrolase of the HAD superfamily